MEHKPEEAVSEAAKKTDKKEANILQKIIKEIRVSIVYFYKVTMCAIKKKDLRAIIPLVLIIVAIGFLLFSRSPGVNETEVLSELDAELSLPEGDPEVRTVAADDKIAKDDAFLTDAEDNFVIVSYLGLDILYNQDTNEVVRSRSYAPGSL